MKTAVISAAIFASGLTLATSGGSTNSSVQPVSDTNNNVTLTSSKQADNAVPPAPQPKMVTVNPGDYLTKIADENSTTALRIFYANTAIQDPDLIYPGQQLRIPTADEQLTPRAVPADTSSLQTSAPPAEVAPAALAPTVTAPTTSAADYSVWDRIAACESSGDWSINTGNGYYGGLQFTLSSWYGVGGTGLPSDASRDEQIARAQILESRQGWGAWPVCSIKAGV